MGKSTISMAMFQFANCSFTRGYIPRNPISALKFPQNPMESLQWMVHGGEWMLMLVYQEGTSPVPTGSHHFPYYLINRYL